MTLYEYEDKVKKLLSEDINNGEAYSLMIEMVKIFLLKRKCCECDEDYNDIAQMITSDIYIKLSSGCFINKYMGFLEKVWKRYVFDYYNYEAQVIDTGENEFLLDAKQLIFGKPSSSDYREIENKVYLENIIDVINETMETSCKYDHSSPSYYNLKLSLLLSILRDEEVYFHLNIDQKFYLRLLYTSFKAKVHKDGVDII